MANVRGVDDTVEDLKAVAVHPGDVRVHPINLGVVLGTSQRVSVSFDGDDALPMPRQGKGYGIATRSAKDVNDGGFGGESFADITRYLAG